MSEQLNLIDGEWELIRDQSGWYITNLEAVIPAAALDERDDPTPEQYEASARAASASPELYAACVRAHKLIAEMCRSMLSVNKATTEFKQVESQLDAAIAKAEGRQAVAK